MDNLIKDRMIQRASSLLKDWGREDLLRPWQTAMLRKIRDDYSRIIAEGIASGEVISQVLENMGKEILKAVDVINNQDLFIASQEDPIWVNAREALDIFDSLLYYSHAIRHLAGDVEETVKMKAVEKLDEEFEKIHSRFLFGDLSALRLTAINDYRREICRKIGADNADFPWYTLFTDEKYDDIVPVLSWNYNLLYEKRWDELADIMEIEDPADLIPISQELARDGKLSKYVAESYREHLAIGKVLSGLTLEHDEKGYSLREDAKDLLKEPSLLDMLITKFKRLWETITTDIMVPALVRGGRARDSSFELKPGSNPIMLTCRADADNHYHFLPRPELISGVGESDYKSFMEKINTGTSLYSFGAVFNNSGILLQRSKVETISGSNQRYFEYLPVQKGDTVLLFISHKEQLIENIAQTNIDDIANSDLLKEENLLLFDFSLE